MKQYNYLLAAIAVLSIASCAKEIEAPKVSEPQTITFNLDSPDSKTSISIDGTTAHYSWGEDEVFKVVRYDITEPFEAVNSSSYTKNANGTATISATFGTTATLAEYAAVYPSSAYVSGSGINSVTLSIPCNQKGIEGSFDPSADLMISRVVDDAVDGSMLSFKRLAAVARMTIKGLSDCTINKASFSVNGVVLAGTTSANLSQGTYSSPYSGENKVSITYASPLTANAAGTPVFFTCLPNAIASGSAYTITVETSKGVYIKRGTFSSDVYLNEGDVLSFGVNNLSTAGYQYEKLTSEPLDWSGKYLMVGVNNTNYYAFDGTIDSSSKWGKTAAVVAENNCIEFDSNTSNYEITIEKASDGLYTITQANGYYLSSSAVGYFKFAEEDNNTDNTHFNLSMNASGEVIIKKPAQDSGKTRTIQYNYNYGSGGFRWYDNGTLTAPVLFKKAVANVKSPLVLPQNLNVTGKTISWDSVENAGSYSLTIGSSTVSVTETSYTATVKDDYYNVSVVAVPSDNEHFKNSGAAVLSNAKIGDPKIDTPVLVKGAVDESSITISWTNDTRSNGYTCDIFLDNGDGTYTNANQQKTNVTSGSATFTSLNDGQAYQIRVYANEVTGSKAYKASEVASISATTKGATHISDITAAGTYTVKNAVVYANSSTQSIVYDGTGYAIDYGTARTVGDILTLAGSVEAYNGVWEFNKATGTKTGATTPSYPTPVELTADEAASLTSNPRIEYVTINCDAPSSGSTVTIGSYSVNVYTLNSYAGKRVRVKGYNAGVKADGTIPVVPVSIEDVTPTLSIDKFSKIWASSETDAFTVNVTATNGTWSVTPTSLTWATITVDTENNQIIVTPKGSNTSDADYTATLTVSNNESAGLNKSISLTQRKPGATITTLTENFSSSKASTNNYDCSSSISTAANQSDWDYSWTPSGGTVFKNGIKLGTSKATGSISNSTMLAEIPTGTSIKVKVYAAVWNTDAGKVKFTYNGSSTTTDAANDAITSTSSTYSADDFSSATEFSITKVEDVVTIKIESSSKRILIDKVEVVY